MEDQQARIDELMDREAIRQCLSNYCRGLDRLDAELAKSAYHDDARDDHQAYVGSGHGLVDWANEYHVATFSAWQHVIANNVIELDGDTAHSETYYFLAARMKDTNELHMGGGRYIDRLERRDGRWAIAARICTTEWNLDAGLMAMFIPMQFHIAMDRTDPSYQRPLQVERNDHILPLRDEVHAAATSAPVR
jgi:hypothetical protein